MINKSLFTSNCQDWSTPKDIYNFFMIKGYIDPCPLKSDIDNLGRNYNNVKLFINPPFNDLNKWADFVIRNMSIGFNNHIVLLLPARTDTIYFHKLLDLEPHIFFIKGRLKFGNSNKCAPFPTILMVFDTYKHSSYSSLKQNYFSKK